MISIFPYLLKSNSDLSLVYNYLVFESNKVLHLVLKEISGTDPITECHNTVWEIVGTQPLQHTLLLQIWAGCDVDYDKTQLLPQPNNLEDNLIIECA